MEIKHQRRLTSESKRYLLDFARDEFKKLGTPDSEIHAQLFVKWTATLLECASPDWFEKE